MRSGRRRLRGTAHAAAAVALGAVMVSVLAAPPSARAAVCTLTGAGTTVSPYLVADATDLAKVGVGDCPLSAIYRQTQDVTLTGAWAPIADGTAFTGVYDGGGRSITGLDVQGAGIDQQGLFAEMTGDGAIVRDLVLVAPTVAGRSNVGPVVGSLLNGSSVIDVEVRGGSVTGTNGQVGGLVGEAGYRNDATYTTPGLIRGSSSSATVIGTGTYLVGGLVGYAYRGMTIEDVSASGTVTAAGSVGGLVGSISTAERPIIVRDASASGDVTSPGGFGVGGLIGEIDHRESGIVVEVTDVSASGTVVGGAAVGGLLGYLWSGGATSTIRITRASAGGAVSGTGDGVGGLIGETGLGATTSVIEVTRTQSSGDVTVTGARANVGGLVGHFSGLITESFATGDVSAPGSTNVGGLVGRLGALSWDFSTRAGTLRDVHAAGAVDGDDDVGGLVGLATEGEVTRALARGAVTSANAAGGLVARIAVGTLSQSGNVWDTETTGQTTSAGDGTTADVAGFETADLALLATYSGRGWGIVTGWASPDATATPPSVWGICARANDGYSFLRWTGTAGANDCTEPTVAAVATASRLALDCAPDPSPARSMVVCTITGADPDIEFVWTAAPGTSPATGVVRVDGSGRGSFTFRTGDAGSGPVRVELVAWGVTDTVRVVGGAPVPSAIPAGDGPVAGPVPRIDTLLAVALLVGLLAAALLTVRRPARR